MPSPRGINVVFLYVADLDGMRRFYENIVGFGPPAVVEEGWIEFSADAGASFALHRSSPEALAGIRPEASPLRFSIVVDDLDEACRPLLEHDVRFVRYPEEGPGFRLAEFLDPEHNPVRFIQFLPTAT